MTTPRDEAALRQQVIRELGLAYDPYNVEGALDMAQNGDPTAAVWLLRQALPLAKRYVDARVQLDLELNSPDTVEDEYQVGLETAAKIVRGLP